MLDYKTLAFADFGGNRQYITLGNLSDNPKALIFLMHYANSQRVKLWGILSPHKVYSSSTNDMILQLRKRRIEKVVMAGPAGILCVEAHFRDLLECGFEVAMVRNAIGGTLNEEGDGVQAALVNYRFLAHALWTTEEVSAKFADLSRAARFNGVEPQRAEAVTNSGSAS